MMVTDRELSPETVEALTDEEFARAIRYIAMDLGADATLADVKKKIDAYKPLPTREVNGVTYKAGYRGAFMVPKGTRYLTLTNVEEKGKTIKFMFTTTDKHFIYHSVPKEDIAISEIIERSKQIGATFPVHVHHEVIENIGEYHATVSTVEWSKRNENFVPISMDLPPGYNFDKEGNSVTDQGA
jgi:hypothetical protein